MSIRVSSQPTPLSQCGLSPCASGNAPITYSVFVSDFFCFLLSSCLWIVLLLRLRRIGQASKTVLIQYMVGRGTMDDTMLSSIHRKQSTLKSTVGERCS